MPLKRAVDIRVSMRAGRARGEQPIGSVAPFSPALVRDTEDYRIKPHPDGLNKIVTFQLYLPPDESTLDLGTSLFVRNRGLLGSRFEEVKRFPFRPNSGYAFAVSDSAKRTSWHGREKLTGFSGVRNTLMILFQQVSPRTYSA